MDSVQVADKAFVVVIYGFGLEFTTKVSPVSGEERSIAILFEKEGGAQTIGAIGEIFRSQANVSSRFNINCQPAVAGVFVKRE